MSTTPEPPESQDPTAERWAPPPPPPPPAAMPPADAPPPPVAPSPDAPLPPPSAAPPPAPSYGPPSGYAAAPAYGAPAGAIAPLSPQEERGWSLAAHLLVLVGGFLAPLIIWLVFKGRGPFLEHHAKESLNFQITVTIAMVVAFVLMFVLVGIVLVLALLPWMFILPIIAAVKANNGEWYRYPLTLRLIT